MVIISVLVHALLPLLLLRLSLRCLLCQLCHLRLCLRLHLHGLSRLLLVLLDLELCLQLRLLVSLLQCLLLLRLLCLQLLRLHPLLDQSVVLLLREWEVSLLMRVGHSLSTRVSLPTYADKASSPATHGKDAQDVVVQCIECFEDLFLALLGKDYVLADNLLPLRSLHSL